MNLSRFGPVASGLLRKPTCPLALQKRLLYEQTRAGSVKLEEKQKQLVRQSYGSEMARFKASVKDFKKDLAWSLQRAKDVSLDSMRSDNKRFQFDENETIKFWDFNQANNDKISSFRLDNKNDKLNDFNNWHCTCDSDFDVG